MPMKNIHKIALIVSFIALIALFSLLSMLNYTKEFRYTWQGMNPWNGVEGVVFTVNRFLHTGEVFSWLIGTVLILFIWWRLYALLKRVLP